MNTRAVSVSRVDNGCLDLGYFHLARVRVIKPVSPLVALPVLEPEDACRGIGRVMLDCLHNQWRPIVVEYPVFLVRVAHGPLVQSLAHLGIGDRTPFLYGTRKFGSLGNPLVDCRGRHIKKRRQFWVGGPQQAELAGLLGVGVLVRCRPPRERFRPLTLSGHWSGCRCTVVMTPGERLRREFQPNLRDEMLNTGIFYMLKEAIVLIEGWSYRYDMVRPHSSLRS